MIRVRVLSAWVQASRPLAHTLIAPPLLLGQALALALHGTFAWSSFAWIHGFGVLDQLFILWLNDLSDVESDRGNQGFTRFSGGSRVLVDGKLAAVDLRNGTLVVLGLLIVAAAALATLGRRPLVPALIAAGVCLVAAYSLPPLRLAYRGGGELLQALGVGALLPLFGYYVQTGTLEVFPWPVLAGALVVALGANVTTSLPDHDADRASDKRTWTVRRGPRAARRESVFLIALGTGALAAACPLLGVWTRAVAACLACIPLALNLCWLGTRSPEDRVAQEAFLTANGAAITLAWLVPATALALR